MENLAGTECDYVAVPEGLWEAKNKIILVVVCIRYKFIKKIFRFERNRGVKHSNIPNEFVCASN